MNTLYNLFEEYLSNFDKNIILKIMLSFCFCSRNTILCIVLSSQMLRNKVYFMFNEKSTRSSIFFKHIINSDIISKILNIYSPNTIFNRTKVQKYH